MKDSSAQFSNSPRLVRGLHVRRWLAVFILAAMLIALATGAAAGREAAPWLVQAVASRQFLISAGVGGVSALALLLMCGVLWQAGRPYRRLRRGEEGTVILEFALALPFALMLSLVMIQSSLLMGGNLCVHYAAYCAARSAIVQIPDDRSPSEPPNVLVDPYSSSKLQNIRLAAVWAVMPVSSSRYTSGDADTLVDGLASFFDSYGEERPGWLRKGYLGRKWSYADAAEHTKITMLRRDNPRSSAYPDYSRIDYPYTYGENEEVRVQVDHTFNLAIPYAAWLFSQIDGDGRRLDFGTSEYGLVIHAATSLANEGVRDYIEEEDFDFWNP